MNSTIAYNVNNKTKTVNFIKVGLIPRLLHWHSFKYRLAK